MTQDDIVTNVAAWALERDMLTIPILLSDAEMPSESALPLKIGGLARRNELVLSNESWDQGIYRLDDVRERLGATL